MDAALSRLRIRRIGGLKVLFGKSIRDHRIALCRRVTSLGVTGIKRQLILQHNINVNKAHCGQLIGPDFPRLVRHQMCSLAAEYKSDVPFTATSLAESFSGVARDTRKTPARCISMS